MSIEGSSLDLAGPEGPAGSTLMQQQQSDQQNNAAASSYMGNSSFFGDSPMMTSASMMDIQTRLSPPSSTSFLNMPLPETPTNTGNKMSMDAGVSLDHKLKRSAAVVTKLMNAERHIQNQREKRNDDSPGLPQQQQQSQQRLFAPLESNPHTNNMMRQQNPSTTQQQQPGPMTNMLRSARLSSSAGEEGFFDMSFAGNDFAYQFSPGEIVRSLGGAPIPESPLTQNLRMFPYSAGAYNPMGVGQTPSWQFPSHAATHLPPNHPLTTAYSTGSVGGDLSLPPSHLHHQKGKGMKRRGGGGRNTDSDDSDEDNNDNARPRKKKKTSKPVDPNEPKITSKHRGVCWYKRTKKWVVQTKVNGKRVHVGYFDDEEKAAEAYKNAVQGIQIKKALEAKKTLEDAAIASQDVSGGMHFDQLPH